MSKPALPTKEEMALFLEEQLHPIRKFLYTLSNPSRKRFIPYHIKNCSEAEFLQLHRIVEVDGPDFLLPNFSLQYSYGYVCVSDSGMTLLKKSHEIALVLEREKVGLENVDPLLLAKFYLKIWLGSNAGGHVVEGPDFFHTNVRNFCLAWHCKALRDVYDRVFDKLLAPSISGCREKGWKLSFVNLQVYSWDENAVEFVELNISPEYFFELERITILEKNLFANFMHKDSKA